MTTFSTPHIFYDFAYVLAAETQVLSPMDLIQAEGFGTPVAFFSVPDPTSPTTTSISLEKTLIAEELSMINPMYDMGNLGIWSGQEAIRLLRQEEEANQILLLKDDEVERQLLSHSMVNSRSIEQASAIATSASHGMGIPLTGASDWMDSSPYTGVASQRLAPAALAACKESSPLRIPEGSMPSRKRSVDGTLRSCAVPSTRLSR